MKTKSEIKSRFKHLLSLNKSKRTVEMYSYYIGLFLDFSKNVPMRICNEDALDYNIQMAKEGRSDSFRNGSLSAIKNYFELILRKEFKEYASIRPKKKQILIKQYDFNNFQDKVLGVENVKHRLILMFGLYLGLRISEVVNLKLADIDIEKLQIVVTGKGNKTAVLPLPDNMVYCLYDYVEYYNPNTFVFNGAGDRLQYSTSSIDNIVNRVIGYSFHKLRHAYLQRTHRRTNDILSTSKLARHSNPKTTYTYYVNPDIEQLRAIQNKALNPVFA